MMVGGAASVRSVGDAEVALAYTQTAAAAGLP